MPHLDAQGSMAVDRAPARRPRRLLVDPPFPAVDRMRRRGLYRLLADQRREPAVPIVLVTYDFNQALMLAGVLYARPGTWANPPWLRRPCSSPPGRNGC